MKTNKRRTLIVSALFAVHCLAQTASAFYAPHLQRWVTRDPHADGGSPSSFVAALQPRFEDGYSLTVVFGPFEMWDRPNLYILVENGPTSLVDPFGLSSVHASVLSAIARGDICALESLLATGELNAAQTALVQAALAKYRSTALQYIAKNCQGSIAREFPSQCYNQTLAAIRQAAKAGDKAAKKAWKLINDNRFKKPTK